MKTIFSSSLLISSFFCLTAQSMDIQNLLVLPASKSAAINNLLNTIPTPQVPVAPLGNSNVQNAIQIIHLPKVIGTQSISSILTDSPKYSKFKKSKKGSRSKKSGLQGRTSKRPLHKNAAIAAQCSVFFIKGSCPTCHLEFGTISQLKYHQHIVHELENKSDDKI